MDMELKHDAGAPDAPQGVFITLEGGDGVGKTTQFDMLAAALRADGHEVVTLHEPGGTRVGEKIRAMLLDKELDEMNPVAELLLFEAARAQITAEVIEPALAQGKVVLCDRFFDSTTAYQGFGRELGSELCERLSAVATQGRKPDATILLTLDQQEAARRVSARAEDGVGDRMERAGGEFHARVAEGFAAIAAAEPQRVHVVNAQGTPQEVHERVLQELRESVGSRLFA